MIQPFDVGDNLGRTLTSAETVQAEKWIASTLTLIATRLGDTTLLDQDVLDLVVLEAVSLRMKNPDGVTQREVAVDDGRVSTRWEKATGQINILPEWWELLTPVRESGAFTVRPSYEPDRCHAW